MKPGAPLCIGVAIPVTSGMEHANDTADVGLLDARKPRQRVRRQPGRQRFASSDERRLRAGVGGQRDLESSFQRLNLRRRQDPCEFTCRGHRIHDRFLDLNSNGEARCSSLHPRRTGEERLCLLEEGGSSCAQAHGPSSER